ncbi:MAG: two-component regulator propeller domain-containing protein, partial [Bacteroidota bacterium]
MSIKLRNHLWGLFFLLAAGSFAQTDTSLKLVELPDPGGLTYNSINAFARDSLGYIWMGTDFGLHRFDGKNYRSFYHDRADSTTIPSNIIYYLHVDQAGRLIVGTADGIAVREKNQKGFLAITVKNGYPMEMDRHEITWLHEDRKGDIWITTRVGGLGRLQWPEGKIQHFSFPELHEDLACIEEDPLCPGVFWIGGRRGLLRFELETGKRRVFDVEMEKSEKRLSQAGIASMVFDGDSLIWMAAPRAGLLKYNRKTQHFKRIPLEEGWP